MDALRKTLASTALAGLLVTGSFAAPAFADGGHDNGKGGHGQEDKHKKDHDEKDNGEVDVVIKHKTKHGKWESKRYEDVELKKAAAIAKDKAHGGDYWKYYKDAKYTDKSGKTVKAVEKHHVTVLFEQDDDEKDNGEVDVVIKHKTKHGKWESKRYEDVELKKAAAIAKDKAHGGDYWKYHKDAKYTDKTGKTVKAVEKRHVTVLFEQDNGEKDNGKKH
ncbi:hypothetical protein GCM10011374_37650 [Kocuria dechangensis]|uniref:Uncharacterized protein n=1 Tax=Kocuria dechangensis TaxID=1176249 RepID=A0A917M1W0_9MICC|nr:hypothetical protein [Kocuria dechangensis]GGG69661.1 hypothetical protein GCM10011374_37650 [Kocuria dechangensis]